MTAQERRCYAIETARSLYPCLGTGRHRTVFDMGDGWVLKLPQNIYGDGSNDLEVQLANSDEPSDIPFARCDMVDFFGIPAVKMEKVEQARGNLPEWTNYVDCGQVGWTQDGRLVAYDFGL